MSIIIKRFLNDKVIQVRDSNKVISNNLTLPKEEHDLQGDQNYGKVNAVDSYMTGVTCVFICGTCPVTQLGRHHCNTKFKLHLIKKNPPCVILYSSCNRVQLGHTIFKSFLNIERAIL